MARTALATGAEKGTAEAAASRPDTDLSARVAALEALVASLRAQVDRGAAPAPAAVQPSTIDTGEAARILGVSKSRMNRLAAAEKLGGKPNGRHWRLVRARVKALARRRRP